MTAGQAFSIEVAGKRDMPRVCDPAPDGIDQRPAWSPKEIPFNHGRTLVLEYS